MVQVNENIMKILKKLWTFGQPLVRSIDQSSTVSDLFLWIDDNRLDTHFDIIDYYSIINPGKNQRGTILLYIFNSIGEIVNSQKFDIESGLKRITIGNYTNKKFGSYGTFAIFHLGTSDIVQNCASTISERGYLSFSFSGSGFKNYVHGNIDAISYLNNNIKYVGGISFFTRTYNLQYIFEPDVAYSIAIVNTTKCSQSVKMLFFKDSERDNFHETKFKFGSGSTKIIDLPTDVPHNYRVVIYSKMVMARPVIFKFFKNSMDVFHG